MRENALVGLGMKAFKESNSRLGIDALMRSIYRFECFRQGRLLWVEEVPNIVVNEGLDDLLDKYFKGSSYTAAWYVGLIDNANFTALAAGDTAAEITNDASGSNQWQEAGDYDEASRQTLTLGSVSSQSVDNSASKAAFTMSGTVTIKGAFVISDNTKEGTTGVLYGAAAFTSARAVQDDDVLNVTVTLTSASA